MEVVLEGGRFLGGGGFDPVQIWTTNLEGPGPMVLLEPWSLTMKDSL